MKFDNAFLCKSGVVGMQFVNSKGAIISVFHDGKKLRCSEDASPKEKDCVLKIYKLISSRFKKLN